MSQDRQAGEGEQGMGAEQLTRVNQRTADDCLTACIATVTGVAYEECPRLWGYLGAEWIKSLSDWSKGHGFGLLYWENPGSDQWPVIDGMLVIASGPVKAFSGLPPRRCGGAVYAWLGGLFGAVINPSMVNNAG